MTDDFHGRGSEFFARLRDGASIRTFRSEIGEMEKTEMENGDNG